MKSHFKGAFEVKVNKSDSDKVFDHKIPTNWLNVKNSSTEPHIAIKMKINMNKSTFQALFSQCESLNVLVKFNHKASFLFRGSKRKCWRKIIKQKNLQTTKSVSLAIASFVVFLRVKLNVNCFM
ncbi:CLUMA_CG017763, isoform A [Clunio marinus]|uniref:CLUMA_CG017763, isoform A n=1 Tax=Clunio marinus TaxID=568069 RepID=A0A1J1IWN6_9DIPT|nr:CLUMA_CG017763, isoform A [Clunio marinus]